MNERMNVSALLGKTLTSVTQHGSDVLLFETDNGETYRMYHEQDCCESVDLEDVAGNLDDLVGSPITMAEEVSSEDRPPRVPSDAEYGSFTWTFYKLATVKGYVTLRWYGASNGYYSESVDFARIA